MTPAGGAAVRARGSPLSWDLIAAGLPKAESGTFSSSSSKNGSISCCGELSVYGPAVDEGG